MFKFIRNNMTKYYNYRRLQLMIKS